MDADTRVAVVTGGNHGLGLETCRQAGQGGGTRVVLTAREMPFCMDRRRLS